MFIDILLEGDIDLDEPDLIIGPIALYQLYINMHLLREDVKSPFLSSKARLEFSRAIAIAMLNSGGALEIGLESTLNVIKNSSRIRNEINREIEQENLEKIFTDLRVSGFLTITSDNKFAFSHKSFMEFFVADTIQEDCSAKLSCPLLDQELNYEILQFLGGFSMYREEYKRTMLDRWSETTVKSNAWTNLSVAHLFTAPKISNHNFSDFDFSGVKISRRTYSHCSFKKVRLSHLECIASTFLQTTFDRTSLSGWFKDIKFLACDGKLKLDGAGVNIEFDNCILKLLGKIKFQDSCVTTVSYTHLTLPTILLV